MKTIKSTLMLNFLVPVSFDSFTLDAEVQVLLPCDGSWLYDIDVIDYFNLKYNNRNLSVFAAEGVSEVETARRIFGYDGGGNFDIAVDGHVCEVLTKDVIRQAALDAAAAIK